MKSAFAILRAMVVQIAAFVLFFAMLGIVAVFAQRAVVTTGEWHWSLGTAVAILILIGVLALFVLIWHAMRPTASPKLNAYMLPRKNEAEDAGFAEQYPKAALTAVICVAMLTGIYVLAGLSVLMVDRGLFEYGGGQPTQEQLFSLYGWHAIDVLPFLDLWNTYQVTSPIEPTNWLAQTAVLVCRTVIIGFPISIIALWIRYTHDPATAEEAGGK